MPRSRKNRFTPILPRIGSPSLERSRRLSARLINATQTIAQGIQQKRFFSMGTTLRAFVFP
jgi:hypothetical protein